ncbi:MAG TPA: tetratricopeptide repeat protein [Limnobacter sp.]|nr:tetratricopeptide repeat protein [Limnobacter sp.]
MKMKSEHAVLKLRAASLTVLLAACFSMGAGSVKAQDSTAADWIRNPAMGNYKAYAEFKMANYETARHIWEILAGLGNADALFNLGILAEDGLGEPKNIQKAESLYVAAANAGGFKAQYRLGMLYSGDNPAFPKDVEKARRYLNLAAAGGDRDAKARLASLDQPNRPLSDYEKAELMSSNGRHEEAAELYSKLVQQGDRSATTRLAWMYEAGRGVERSLVRAAELFMQSAHQGDAEAQYAIAVMYRTGQGQVKNREESLKWLRQSAGQNYPAAVAALAAEGEG